MCLNQASHCLFSAEAVWRVCEGLSLTSIWHHPSSRCLSAGGRWSRICSWAGTSFRASGRAATRLQRTDADHGWCHSNPTRHGPHPYGSYPCYFLYSCLHTASYVANWSQTEEGLNELCSAGRFYFSMMSSSPTVCLKSESQIWEICDC